MDEAFFNYALDIARNEPIELLPDHAVFFTGGRNLRTALDFCKAAQDDQDDKDFQTILSIGPWKRLHDGGLMSRRSALTPVQTKQIRREICQRFSEAARGNITVFYTPTRTKVQRGEFFLYELPKIMANPDIVSINHKSKNEFLQQISRPEFAVSHPPDIALFSAHFPSILHPCRRPSPWSTMTAIS